MKNIKLLFLLATLPILVTSFGNPEFKCEAVGKDTCYLNDVQTTWDEPDFDPKCPTTFCMYITVVEIKSGHIPLLTNSLCSAFGDMESLKLSQLSIEKIDNNGLGALNFCDTLKTLDLSYNNLTNLDATTFKGLWKLEKLNLQGNPIMELSSSFFNYIQGVKEANLAGTLIPYFPFDDNIRNLKKLEVIQLSNTLLLDIEIEKLILHVPSLKSIHLRDTNIFCSRMTEIRNVAASQGLTLVSDVEESKKRQRDYSVTFSGEFECLSKEQWDLEVLKRVVKDTLTETKFQILLESIKKHEIQGASLNDNINDIHENIDQYYVDVAYVSSYISFIGTTLAILLSIVSITSIFMCCKVRRYIEEERYRSHMQQQYQHQNMVIDSKKTLYFWVKLKGKLKK